MRDLLFIRETPTSVGCLLTVCGLEFPEFVRLVERPLNLLALRSLFPDAVTFHEINFDGIRDNLEDQRFNDLEKLLSSPQHLDGDFWWIDYSNEHRLLAIGDKELAELCFLARQGRPLKSPFFESLENRFVYLGHDNGFHTSIFVRDRLDALQMLWKAIENKVLACGFSVTGGGHILDRLHEGVVFDFNAISETGLPVWIYDGDFSFDTFDRCEFHDSSIAETLPTERTTITDKTLHPRAGKTPL